MEITDIILKNLTDELCRLRLEVFELNRLITQKELKTKLLTLKEACEYLNISRTTMQKRLSTGEITFAVKRGKSWLFPIEKLNDYAAGLC